MFVLQIVTRLLLIGECHDDPLTLIIQETTNTIMNFEVGYYLKRKTQGKNGMAALKVDMSKDFNSIEWSFIRDVLSKLGFHASWVSLLMNCISSVNNNIVSSRYTLGPIIPSRGIRQGDLLSPYLLIIYAESLSLLVKKYESAGLIHGCKVARSAPCISHIFFVDDMMFFCRTNPDVWERIKNCTLICSLENTPTS